MVWLQRFLGIFRVAKQEPFYFTVFIMMNFIFGALGLWLPAASALGDSLAHAWPEFLKVWKQGSGYSFSLALLAASASFVFKESSDGNETQFKQLKKGALLFTLVLAVVILTLLNNCITAQFEPMQINGQLINRPPVSTANLIAQCFFTVISVLWAIFLFCLEFIDQYDDYGKDLKDKRREKMLDAINNVDSSPVSDLQV